MVYFPHDPSENGFLHARPICGKPRKESMFPQAGNIDCLVCRKLKPKYLKERKTLDRINRLVAENVMRWGHKHVKNRSECPNGIWCFPNSTDGLCHVDAWRPSETDDGAQRVVEELLKRGLVAAGHAVTRMTNPRSICLAALQVVGIDVRKTTPKMEENLHQPN